jgi:serine protease Do
MHRFIYLILTGIIILSCSVSTGGSDPAPGTGEDAVPDEVSEVVTGLVGSLTDVKSAVIQIEAEGTFVDPEFGEYTGAGRGSGFIIDPSGLALTNNHVVTGAALLTIWVGGDTSTPYNAKIIAVSECSDLALIDIEGDGFPYLDWYPDPIQVGLEIYTAGFPLGDPEYTLTKGIISKEKASGESNWASVNHVIEHDATINPGNSGGPLVTEDGLVVGVNYASYAEANQYFAIGRDSILPLLDQLKAGDDVDTVGINGIAVLSEDGTLSGIWVTSVKSGSAADETGLKPGDLITSMENLALATDGTMASYCDIIRTQGDENTLSMEVLRYPTQELLEGQLNGRTLSAIGTGPGGEDPGDVPPPFADGYIEVTDYADSLIMFVPDSWNEVERNYIWENTWELPSGLALDFSAAVVSAAPSLDAFYNLTGPGVELSASRDWGEIGGYLQLLDGTEHWYIDACERDSREEYLDIAYEGKYDYWICDDVDVVIAAVRPISDPTAFLVLVEIAMQTTEDFDAWEQIWATFEVIDYSALP